MRHLETNAFVRRAGVATAFGAAILFAAAPAAAAVSPETLYIFNTFSFLVHGFLVMFMAAGFAMLESGLVRSKNTAAICLKNIGLFSIAGLMYYLIGYNIMYPGDAWAAGKWLGNFSLLYDLDAIEMKLIGENNEANVAALLTAKGDSVYSKQSDWFFQMVFVATTASIVSGTLAERIKVWPFMIFIVVLTGFIYPIIGSWEWGAGWLNSEWYKSTFGNEFIDFAGSTLVHSTGGWAALAGAIFLGARKGKYKDGRANPIPGANLPLATLGTFILWFGWFGFNGGSQLALGSAADVSAMANVYVATNLAAAAGVVVAMIMTRVQFGKMDLTLCLNGAIGGLVAITAGPDVDALWKAVIIGGIGGALVVLAVPFIDRVLKIDDVVGAISAHLVAGIWGTLAVGIFGGGSFLAQLVGVVAIGVFVFTASSVVWLILKSTIGIRASEEEEDLGLDSAECGVEAYPEFGSGSKLA